MSNIIITLLVFLFKALPKKYVDAARAALDITTRIKQVILAAQENGLLDWTQADEHVIEWLNKLSPVIGTIDNDTHDYLLTLKPASLNAELSHIAAMIMVSEDEKLKTGIAKIAIEITYNKMKRAD